MKHTYHPPLCHIIGPRVMGIFCNGKDGSVMSFEILQYSNTIFSAIINIYIFMCTKELVA